MLVGAVELFHRPLRDPALLRAGGVVPGGSDAAARAEMGEALGRLNEGECFGEAGLGYGSRRLVSVLSIASPGVDATDILQARVRVCTCMHACMQCMRACTSACKLYVRVYVCSRGWSHRCMIVPRCGGVRERVCVRGRAGICV